MLRGRFGPVSRKPKTPAANVIWFLEGRLGFKPRRADPFHIASNGPLGQRTAGAVADGTIMEACFRARSARVPR